MEKTLEIVSFDPKYFDGWEYDGVEIGIFSTEDVKGCSLFFTERGVAYVGLVDGKMIGLAGIMPFMKGVGHAWAFINKCARDHAQEWIPQMVDIEEKVAASYGLHRLQTPVARESRAAVKLIQLLGFKREGLMRKYGPDKKDYYLYARIF